MWIEETRYTVPGMLGGIEGTLYKNLSSGVCLHLDQETWLSRNHVYKEYIRLYKEQKRGKPVGSQVFWTELRKYVNIGNERDRSVNGCRLRGLMFPSRRDMLVKFKHIVPDYDHEFRVEDNDE